MSHYPVLQTRLHDCRLLLESLADLGFADVELHETPQPLVGWRGDSRQQTAEVIIRRRHVGQASNDIGFARRPDGSFEAIISEYDRERYDEAWLGQLNQRYAYRLTRETLAGQDFDLVQEEIDEQGTIRCTVRRMA